MGRDQQNELRRLEAALLEEFDLKFDDSTQQKSATQKWPAFDTSDYRVSNTDHVDVDLDAYSEEVHLGRSGSGIGVLITMVAMVLLSVGILVLFKIMGVL